MLCFRLDSRARHEAALLFSLLDYTRRVKEFAVEKVVASCGEAGESAGDICVVEPGFSGNGTSRAVGGIAI